MSQVMKVPYLGTAEDEVTVSRWHVEEGGRFKKGDCLLVLETLKASFEVEAEGDGQLLRRIVAEGHRAKMHAPLAVWGDFGEKLSDAQLAKLLEEDSGTEAEASGSMLVEEMELDELGLCVEEQPKAEAKKDPAAAPAARKRAKELGIDLGEVTGSGPNGLVRLPDVERYAKEASASGRLGGNGELEPEFARYLREEGEAFGALSSEFKVALYRKHGALLGDGAWMGKGSFIVADRLVVGEDFYLGDKVRIEAIDFECGPMCAFQEGGRVRAREIRLGANAFFAAEVEIGGGGAMDPEAKLHVGSHGFVGEHVHFNPCRLLEIGDEVVVSRGATLMTHSFGASVLEGYPNRFAGIKIGDGCQIGISAVLFPGVEMGAGSILLSGSSLVTSMPAGRLWGGVPAKDLKAAQRVLREDERQDIGRELLREFARQMVLRGHGMEADAQGDELRLTLRREGRHVIRYDKQLPLGEGDLVVEDIRVGLKLAEDVWDKIPIEVTAIDLGGKRIRGPGGPLTDAFREFLRKRGVRLKPRTWSYRGGLL
ncbi:MAG: hypothetical protein CSA62_04865 [Planctomycetota bacterium]|nr:MAG: hypothetical protein CSA62_04865 [Planctomycetota bacterium]